MDNEDGYPELAREGAPIPDRRRIRDDYQGPRLRHALPSGALCGTYYANIERLSREEIRRRREELDRQKKIAETIRIFYRIKN